MEKNSQFRPTVSSHVAYISIKGRHRREVVDDTFGDDLVETQASWILERCWMANDRREELSASFEMSYAMLRVTGSQSL